MLIDHYPLLGLRLTTPRLTLRLPDPDELAALADLAADGIHEPAVMPFTTPWTDLPPAELARSVVTHHWQVLGGVTPQAWRIPFVVFQRDTVVGLQTVGAADFATTREVATGSWLGKRHQGQGIGTEMRAAVLDLAFTGLAAVEAVSGAFEDNPASFHVSRRLGYEPDGIERPAVRGAVTVMRRLRLTRDAWSRQRRTDVRIAGLVPCLPLLGLPAEPA